METFSVLFADGLIVFKLIFSLDLYSQNWPCNSTRNAIPNFAQQNMTVLHYWSNADREDIQILCDVYTFLLKYLKGKVWPITSGHMVHCSHVTSHVT